MSGKLLASALGVLAFTFPRLARPDPPTATQQSATPPLPPVALGAGLAVVDASSAPTAVPPPPAPRARVTFAQAVQRALDRNPSVLVAQAELRRAHALLEQVRAPALPQLSANAAYTQLDTNRVSVNSTVTPAVTSIIQPASSINLDAFLTVPIVSAVNWANWSHAHDQIAVARLAVADTRRQIGALAGRAYLTIEAQRRIIEADTLARDTARAHVDFAHARFAGGIGNRLDEVRAYQELVTDEALLATAALGLERAQEALGVLMGESVPVDSVDDPRLAPPTESQALDDASSVRADVRAQRERVRAAEHASHDSWTYYVPTVTGTFMPFYQNPPTLTVPLTGWQAQVILSVPLFDGGFRYGVAHEREALVAEARATLEGVVRQARSDVRTAVESTRLADAALLLSRQAGEFAHQALGLAELAFRAGTGTSLDVIDAQRRARDADTTVAVAEDNARQARLDLLIASGRFP